MYDSIASYEVHCNVVFTDKAIDILRRWVWRFRNRKKIRMALEKQADLASVDHHSYRYILRNLLLADAVRRQAEPDGWKRKAASKRSIHVNTIYNISEQFEQPARRCEWSVSRLPESSSKKRKMTILER